MVHGPVIRTLPLTSEIRLRTLTESVVQRAPDYVVANTGIGIRGWFSAAESWGLEEALLQALSTSQVLCRGPKAAGAVSAAGLAVSWRAPGEELQEVLEYLLEEKDVAGRRVAVQLDGSQGVGDAAERLVEAGAEVINVPVYRWTLPDDDGPALRLVEAAVSGAVQAVTFTAAPAVDNLFRLAETVDLDDSLRSAFNSGVLAACVGPVCARAAVAQGIADPLVPSIGRLGAMVRALADRLSDATQEMVLAGVRVELRGTVAFVDGARVELRAQERSLLAALAERPGAVVSHERLREKVSAGRPPSRHALEVAITRLRASLGPAGAAVRAVPRRGYRIDAM